MQNEFVEWWNEAYLRDFRALPAPIMKSFMEVAEQAWNYARESAPGAQGAVVPDIDYDIKLIHAAAHHLERVMNDHPYCDHVQVVKHFADIRRDERKSMLSHPLTTKE